MIDFNVLYPVSHPTKLSLWISILWLLIIETSKSFKISIFSAESFFSSERYFRFTEA